MGMLLVGSQVTTNVYLSDHYYDDSVPYDTSDDEFVSSYFDGALYLVKNARGYYGIVNSNGSEIVSPIWNDVEVLSEDRFVVSRVVDSASIAVGILDNYENLVVPLLFNSISQENDYFRVGTLSENGKKILFDRYGNVQLYEEWDSCELDGDIAKVKKDNVTALVTANTDGVCSYTSLYIPTSICGKDFSVTVKSPVCDGTSALEDYLSVVNALSTYCEAIFNSDADTIRTLTNSQYYNSLISNMLPNCQLSHISNVSVYGESDDGLDGAVVYHADVKLTYTSDPTILDDGTPSKEMNTVLVSMQCVRDQDGSIVVRSAEKTLESVETSEEETTSDIE
jgi:hypothetical protein